MRRRCETRRPEIVLLVIGWPNSSNHAIWLHFIFHCYFTMHIVSCCLRQACTRGRVKCSRTKNLELSSILQVEKDSITYYVLLFVSHSRGKLIIHRFSTGLSRLACAQSEERKIFGCRGSWLTCSGREWWTTMMTTTMKNAGPPASIVRITLQPTGEFGVIDFLPVIISPQLCNGWSGFWMDGDMRRNCWHSDWIPASQSGMMYSTY